MKRIFSFIIILQLFTNQEAFAELAKLPFLFHHYNETADEQDFLSFVNEHYAYSHDSNTDHEHGKLPFKHSDDGCSHHPAPSSIKDTKVESNLNIHLLEISLKKYRITNESNFPTFNNNIWQPPKLV